MERFLHRFMLLGVMVTGNTTNVTKHRTAYKLFFSAQSAKKQLMKSLSPQIKAYSLIPYLAKTVVAAAGKAIKFIGFGIIKVIILMVVFCRKKLAGRLNCGDYVLVS
jgi:hypothetical protein